MKLTPSSTARFRTSRASSGSLGSPQIPFPVRRMAPKPRRFTSRSLPIVNVLLIVIMAVVLMTALALRVRKKLAPPADPVGQVPDLPSARMLMPGGLGRECGRQVGNRPHWVGVVRGQVGDLSYWITERTRCGKLVGSGLLAFITALRCDKLG